MPVERTYYDYWHRNIDLNQPKIGSNNHFLRPQSTNHQPERATERGVTWRVGTAEI